MNILVIGGTGFVGSNLVRYLAGIGHNVKVYHRSNSSLKNLDGINYSSVTGNICHEKKLCRAMEECSAVFNLAACGSSLKKDNAARQQINVDAAALIAKTARKTGNLRLVHVSSIAAVGTPERGEVVDETFQFNHHNNHYAYTKYLGELEVLKEIEQGLDAVIACPGNVVGCNGMKENQLNNFRNISVGKMKVYPPGGVCLTDVDDLIKGLMLCVENGISGKRYILGGHNVSFKKYFTEIANATDGTAPVIRLPKTILPSIGFGVGFIFGLLGKETSIDKDTCVMISNDLFYSSELAIKELGYSISDFSVAISKASMAIGKVGTINDLAVMSH
jgi:Nucleoside-diphosphate-sugar epimerases